MCARITASLAAAAFAGLLAGTSPVAKASTESSVSQSGAKVERVLGKALAADAATSTAPSAKHDCKGKNDCKGMGGCGSSDGGCKGKNSCKGKGGCNMPAATTPAKAA